MFNSTASSPAAMAQNQAEPLPKVISLSPDDLLVIRQTLNQVTEEGLLQYKKLFQQQLSSQRPFTESQLKFFHEEILQGILSSYDLAFEDSLDAPKVQPLFKKAKEKLVNEINSLLETQKSTHDNNLKTLLRLLKDCTADAENRYFDEMAEFQTDDQTLEAVQAQHSKIRENVLKNFEDTVIGKHGLNYEPWMANELKSKLDDHLNDTLADKVSNSHSMTSGPEDILDLGSKLDHLSGLVEKLTIENERLREETKRTENNFKNQIERLEDSVKELANKNQSLQDEISAANKVTVGLEENIQSLEDASESLNVDLVNHMDELETALNIAEKSNDDLKDQVLTVQENLDSKSALIFDLLGRMDKVEKSVQNYPTLKAQMETMEKRLTVLESFKTKSQEMFAPKSSGSSLEKIKPKTELFTIEKSKVTQPDSVTLEKPHVTKTSSITMQNGKPKVVAVTLKNIPKENPFSVKTARETFSVRRVATRSQQQESFKGRSRSKLNVSQVKEAIKNFEDKSLKKPGNSTQVIRRVERKFKTDSDIVRNSDKAK